MVQLITKGCLYATCYMFTVEWYSHTHSSVLQPSHHWFDDSCRHTKPWFGSCSAWYCSSQHDPRYMWQLNEISHWMRYPHFLTRTLRSQMTVIRSIAGGSGFTVNINWAGLESPWVDPCSSSMLMPTWRSVSYTHLDVYKRQEGR